MNIRRAFRVAVGLVDRMASFKTIEAGLHAENLRPGRPRGLNVEQLFTLLLTMQLTKRAPHLEGVVTMYEDLHWGDVKQLGLERLTTNQVRYLFDRLDEYLALTTDIEPNHPGKSTNLSAELQLLMDQFASTSDVVANSYPRSVAIDGTRISIPAKPLKWVVQKGKKKRAIYADPDITFHAMPKSNDGRTEYNSSQGYGATTVVNVDTGNGLPLTTAAFNVADMTMTYTEEHVLGAPLVDFLGRTSSVDEIYMDTGYSIHADFRAAVRRNDMRPHMPLHPIHQSSHDIWDGIIASADVLVCPGAPETLLSIKGVGGDELASLVSERAAYELRRHGAPAGESSQRFTCPARAKRVRCPLYSPSMRLPTSLPTVLSPPGVQHKICEQETVTVPQHMLSFLQERPFGSVDHSERVGYRQPVESSYRQLKSLSSGGLTRDAVAVRGLVKFAMLFGCILAAENVRRALSKLKAHLSDTPRQLSSRFPWLDLKNPVLQALTDTASDRGPPD